MKEKYLSNYTPAIPVIKVRLYCSTTDEFAGPFVAILDTGSDATIVPLSVLTKIGAEETAPGWMIGITGSRQPVPLFFIDIFSGDLGFPGIRVIGDENASEIIIGRDVLNKLPIFLDGVQQETIILDDIAVNRLRTRQ